MKTLCIQCCMLMIVLCTLVHAQAPDTLWTRIFGTIYLDWGASVQQTTDGGYIITGTMNYITGYYANICLIKTDANGDALWTQVYGGSGCDFGNSVQQTTDGGYIITGCISSSDDQDSGDVCLIKTDSTGNTLWIRTYGGSDKEMGRSVQQTTDSGYIITGQTRSYGAGLNDVYLIKTDSGGDTLWTRTFGGVADDMSFSVQQTTDGGYIIAGTTNYERGMYLIKTDASGDRIWTRIYGGSVRGLAFSVQQTEDDGYIMTGTKDYDICLVKTDSLGDSLWMHTYVGGHGHSVQQMVDGGYIVVCTGAGVHLLKTDSLGNTLWTGAYESGGYDSFVSGQQTQDGGYIITGQTDVLNPGNWDIYLVKLGPETGVEEKMVIKDSDKHKVINATILSGPLLLPEGNQYQVFDISGRRVDAARLSPGIYFIESDGTITQKIVKVR